MNVDQSWIADIAVLNERLRKETWYNTFWSKFAGFTDISKDDNGNPVYSPSGKPIEVLNGFVQEGRDNMLIPFLSALSGSPKFGDTVLKGTGEEMSMKWLRSYVNQVRKAVMKKSGSMAQQRAKLYKLYEAALPLLKDYFSKLENQYVYQAFYEGINEPISAGTSADGIGLKKRLHPNWYVNDGGVLTKVGTEKYTKLASEVDTAVGNADTGLTASILKLLRVKCMNLRIPQIVTKNGFKFWAIIVHPDQMNDLMNDEKFYKWGFQAWNGKAIDSPLIKGSIAHWNGFVFFEDIVGIRGWDTTNDDMFGSTTAELLAPTDVTDNYNAIVFGNSAVGKGIAEKLHFTSEIDDHENTTEIGGAMINGYNRADFVSETNASESVVFDNDNASAGYLTTAYAVENTSSLILMTT